MLKKFPSGKINVTKNALFFLSRAAIHHSFTFNSQFLYQLKHKVHLSKIVCGIFHFWFWLVFIKVYIFVQQKECVRLRKWYQYIFSISLKSGAYYITGQWGEFIQKCYLMLSYTVLVVFQHEICVFMIFISFFDEVSHSRNRISTNQKYELVVSNCQWNCMKSIGSLTLKRDNSIQNKNIEKPHTVLLPDLWFLSCNKKFENSMISAWAGAPKNWPGDEFSKLRKSKFWVRHSFSIVNFK